MLRYFVALKCNVTSGTPLENLIVGMLCEFIEFCIGRHLAYESDIADTAPITLYML